MTATDISTKTPPPCVMLMPMDLSDDVLLDQYTAQGDTSAAEA